MQTYHGSGDYSFTMWQLNYFGNPGRGLQNVNIYPIEPFILRENIPGRRPVEFWALGNTIKIQAWKLLFTNWEQLGEVNSNEALRNVIRKYDKNLEGVNTRYDLVDPRATSIINQIQLLKHYVSNYNDKKGWRFTPWGQYDGAPKYGWIRDTKFKTASKFYLENNPGAKEETLIAHVRRFYFNNKGEPSNVRDPDQIAVLDRWFNGEVFK